MVISKRRSKLKKSKKSFKPEKPATLNIRHLHEHKIRHIPPMATWNEEHNIKTYYQLMINNERLAMLKTIQNNGGGSCLFASILQYLTYIRYRPLPRSVSAVRKAVVNRVVDNWDAVFFVMLDNYADKMQELSDKYECHLDYSDKDLCKRGYRHFMSKPETYGTEIELTTASQVYGFDYFVLVLDEEGTTIRVQSRSGESSAHEPLFLLFSGDLDAGHYNFMIRTSGNVQEGLYELEQNEERDDVMNAHYSG